MNDLLRTVMSDVADGSPPTGLSVGEVLIRSRRYRARRRRTLVSVASAVLVPALGLGVAFAVTRPPPSDPVPPGGPAAPPALTAPPTDPGPDPTSAAPPATGQPGDLSAPASGAAAPGRSTGTGSAANLLADPGVEKDPPGWRVFGPATVLTPSTEARSGARALRVTTTSTTTTAAGATSSPVLVTTTAGVRYSASCWVRSASGIGAYVQVQEYTKDWKRAGDAAPSPKTTLADPNRWYQVSVSYVARHSGNQLPLTVYSFSLLGGGAALLVDDCSMTVGSAEQTPGP